MELETEARQDIQVSIRRQDRGMKNHVLRQDKCLDTPITGIYI